MAADEAAVEELAAKIPPNVLMISGCKDSQTSADVSNTGKFELPDDAGPGGAGGACTTSLVSVLEDPDCPNPIQWTQLLKRMRTILDSGGFSQVPQLSCGRKMDISEDVKLLKGSPGRARALLIGINYVGQNGELRGCHNDVEMMRRQLVAAGYSADNMRLLMDDGAHDLPTRDNILKGFRWLVDGAAAGDSRFMHYSGHGGSVRDDSGDETDGKDETLCPVDYAQNGMIPDDEISESLIFAMPKDVNLTCLMDCCHSGTILDLPYCVRFDDQTVQMVEAGETPSMMVNPGFNVQKAMGIAKIAFEEYQQMQRGGEQGGWMSCLMRCFMRASQEVGKQ